MKFKISNSRGEVLIDTEVIAKFAGTIAVECMGIVGMASINMTDGLVRLLRKESLAKGISVRAADKHLIIDFHVIVAYGVNISAVTNNLIETVTYKVREFVGVPVAKINVFVEGVREID